MGEPDVGEDDALPLRIQKLERQLRSLKLVGSLLLVVGLGYTIVKGVTDNPVEVKKIMLESQEVKLVDTDGKTRLFLRLYSKVPILQLIGTSGKPRLSLGLRFDDTPFIDLSDRDGGTRAVFELTKDDEPTLKLIDKQGQVSFQIN